MFDLEMSHSCRRCRQAWGETGCLATPPLPFGPMLNILALAGFASPFASTAAVRNEMQSSFFRDDDDDERNRMECFRSFDSRNEGHWDADDCRRFVEQLLNQTWRSPPKPNMAAETLAREISSAGRIDAAVFEILWSVLVRPLLKPTAALIVVDVQNDFIDGSLAMRNCPAGQEGADVIPVINALIRDAPFATVAYSMDCHPSDHISFHDNLHLHPLAAGQPDRDVGVFDSVLFEGSSQPQTLWPRHCVEGTQGARFHDHLHLCDDAVMVKKGTDRCVDSYSAFFDNARRGRTALDAELTARGVTHAFVCGLAVDYCVGFTALDALGLGYPTVLVRDASRGTDVQGMARMEAEIRGRHGVVADAREVPGLVEGSDIREEFLRVLLIKTKKLLEKSSNVS